MSPALPTTKIASKPQGIASSESVSSLVDDVPWDRSLLGAAVGRYHIVGILGRGGIGTVFLAEHPEIGARVAIKVLHPHVAVMPGMSKRFVREARATNIVDNPHVLKIQDFGKLDDGRDYAVMPYLRGSPLDKLMGTAKRLPLSRALRLLLQASDGISAAHACGITHRDVKPANMFVTDQRGDDHLFVLDFGIARLVESEGASAITSTGMLVGTPGYCAPEQARQGAVGPPPMSTPWQRWATSFCPETCCLPPRPCSNFSR
jgi:serine/threonine-protein kinase